MDECRRAVDDCASNRYPRTLAGVLSNETEREHVVRMYFSRVHKRMDRVSRYYNYLQLLAQTDSEILWSVLRRVRDRVAAEFAGEFVMVNDFFSFRDASERLFPEWHQDNAFWMAGDDRCTGFNLWILLAASDAEIAKSFEVYDVARERAFYEGLYAEHNPRLAGPLLSPRGWVDGKFDASRARLRPGGPTREPLALGDALVLRQLEIHRTDDDPLDAGHRRLALGFKFIERDAALVEMPEPHFAFGHDLGTVRRKYPGLLGDLRVGAPFPDAYSNRSELAALGSQLHDSPTPILALAGPILSFGALIALSRRRRPS